VFDWGEGDFAFHVPVLLAGMPQENSHAVCKAYADEKLSLSLLWENPDPSADFPAQMVDVDLQGCRFVICQGLVKAGMAEYQTSGIVKNLPGNAGYLHSLHTEGGDAWLNWRKFTLRYNGIQFDKAWARDLAANTVYEDERTRSVPVAVYGIRGAQI
jgi:hypothetical protein